MRLILISLIFNLTFISQLSFGYVGVDRHKIINEVCESWTHILDESKSLEFLNKQRLDKKMKRDLVFRTIFNKKSLIEIASTRSITASPLDVLAYSVGVLKTSATNEQEIITTQKKVKKMNNRLIKLLRKSSSLESCISKLSDSSFSFQELADEKNKLQDNARSIQDMENMKIAKMVKKTLRRKTHKPVYDASLDILIKNLKTQGESVAILVLHSSKDGKLYDSDWNFIPRSLLRNLSPNIKTLIIFSCYTSAVRKRYMLNDIQEKSGIKIILPEVHPNLGNVFKNKTPASIFPLFVKHALRNVNAKTEKVMTGNEMECSIHFDTTSILNGEFGVFLNQVYIGKINKLADHVTYDCNLKGSKNILTLQSLNLFNNAVIEKDQLSMSFFLENGESMFLHHSYGTIGYIGSKGDF